MTDLTAFIRARLDEDELAAKAATPGPWWYNPGKQWLDAEAFERYDLAKGEEFVGYGGPHPFAGAVAATGPADNPQSMADAAHIARHDPARVLAEVRAKRRIIEIAFEHAAKVDGEWGCCHDSEEIEAGLCEETDPSSLDLLRLLALPYAGHPSYDEAWRP